MRKRTVSILLSATLIILSGCGGGLSAQDLTDYYAQQAKDAAAQAAKTAASDINQAIDNNETASAVKDGLTTTGEYAQDAYDYITDPNTVNSAKNAMGQAAADSANFLEYMTGKLDGQWNDLLEDLVKSPSEFDYNYFDDMQNISEYDFYGDFKNIFLEAKGIDTSGNGTAMDQLKVALGVASDFARQTAQNIKDNHDQKHPDNPPSGTGGGSGTDTSNAQEQTKESADIGNILLPLIPEYSGTQYLLVNNNKPFFDESELTTTPFEIYSELDSLGRCGVAYANICPELMPTEDRTSIGNIQPSGFKQKRYDHLKTDYNPYGYLYARCHLIAFCLAGENDNEKNLITGTLEDFNVNGMEPFEIMTSYYVKSTGHHVLYRVTPIYNGNELVARGVLMEAQSVEDNGLSFCVFVYNAASGVAIDYATGESTLSE